jgi:hypothetical protein
VPSRRFVLIVSTTLRRSRRRAVCGVAFGSIYSRVLLCSGLFLGCAHTELLEGGVLHKGDVSVRLGPVPAGWRPLSLEGADAAYRDEEHEGSVMFDVRCHRRDDDAPLSALTGQLVIGTTERETLSEESAPFDGREVLHTRMRAKLDGVPMQYDLFVLKKDGCVYDLVYVAPPARSAEGEPDFERFARGLHAENPSAGVGHAPRAPVSDR